MCLSLPISLDEGNGRSTTTDRKRGSAAKDHGESEDGEAQSLDPTNLVLKLTAEGRYICHICEKTFKTTNILRTHLFTHTDRKDFKCDMCGTAFRTKGSLIRHKRRHTDERPYRCNQCGLSFRESGALTRHLKSLTPCTEKIRYSQCKEILVSKDGIHKDIEAFPSRSHKCPQCDRPFRTLSHLRVHIKGHVGYKPFKCPACQKEFLTGYMLKKHMEVHVSERRYKCGECGKLFKAIGHVREHMRAHSNERPHRCGLCDKSYKTKNALQVHLRTHGEEKPYVCPHCSRGFREKGALVRHIRHHTGEKPFKCSKCGRGFAEHGTLNRHLRSKGGCFAVQQKESEQAALSSEEQQDSVAATIISEDPHAVLVEFSSVVADTQEYIIGASAEETAQGEEEVSIIQDNHDQMDSHIMKVVQQIVNHSRGHQIIVRDVGANESPGVSDCGDTITIATPESLTEQVAMTLANAISDGTILTTSATEDISEMPHAAVTMVTAEDVELMEQEPQYVIAASDEMEIQTVVVV
uniref:Transcription factor E4F1 n=1 Tax=Electrophorus electricus TaxID=8005 RepID=A0AAY5EBM6_ELEEL